MLIPLAFILGEKNATLLPRPHRSCCHPAPLLQQAFCESQDRTCACPSNHIGIFLSISQVTPSEDSVNLGLVSPATQPPALLSSHGDWSTYLYVSTPTSTFLRERKTLSRPWGSVPFTPGMTHKILESWNQLLRDDSHCIYLFLKKVKIPNTNKYSSWQGRALVRSPDAPTLSQAAGNRSGSRGQLGVKTEQVNLQPQKENLVKGKDIG